MPNSKGALVLSWLRELESSQWWDGDDIARHQFSQLGTLLAHVRRTVPFYGPRLDAIGWREGEPVSADQWRQFAVLRRPEVQVAGQALASTDVPPGHGKTFPQMTSGSTGRPIRTLGTGVTSLKWRALTIRDHEWHGRDYGQTLAVIRQFPAASTPPPGGSAARNWGPATSDVLSTGPCVLLDINRTVRDQAEWLCRRAPGYLLTYPSNARALARHFSAAGMKLPSLLEVRTFGELVDPSVRDAVEDAWHVPVVDMYSSQEVGYIALECPGHGRYHVQSESLLVEVVDGDGNPCAPGSVGTVVVSDLHNFATPLLRYEVGDYAEVGHACPCGRGLPVLNRVLGRQRNMLRLPNGDQRWPTFGDPEEFQQALAQLPPILQFQAIQRDDNTVEVKLVSPGTFGPREESIMRDYMVHVLGYPFDIVFSYVDEIPRSAGGKFEDFRSELETRP